MNRRIAFIRNPAHLFSKVHLVDTDYPQECSHPRYQISRLSSVAMSVR